MKKLYAAISKVEAQEDGTIKVWGFASSEAVDSDGETITADAMKAALPDYMKFGAVREMHQNSAAGTAIEANVDEMGKTFFGAHIVDPVAVKKVQTGVYKGFSIGGKVTVRDDLNKTIIKGIKLVEVSLVDRPANPEAVFTMYKAEEGGDLKKTDGAAIPEDPDPAPDEAVKVLVIGGDPLRKGMYSVGELASLLSAVSWVATDAEYESQYEGDASPIPVALREWLASGCKIFMEMAAEEVAEMQAGLLAMVPTVDPLEMSAGVGDLLKAGATLSTATKDKLATIKETIQAAMGHLDELMTVKDSTDDDKENADAVADLQKSAQVSADALLKVEGENAALKKRVAALEAVPAPSKVITKTTVVSKDEDAKAEALTKAEAEEFEKMSPEQKAESMLKKMFKRQTRT